ncbi:uncharacterized protein EDB93DRAFT_241102 [Suillus bovinus]|uniref:uncharacterized protein n=1 Tax=Suillus bovinus TaxID=48563 RepID=UPI001B86B6EC|nr:uncharacterized protein EDB93DRAFT_241102 [Suillus bovinus]KAG2153071.1 hypothetical protein EDB93DRAFT_241102 [Suillus bovinus]
MCLYSLAWRFNFAAFANLICFRITFDFLYVLSGPIAVEGAETGDCLIVDILDVRPFDKMPWGYTISTLTNIFLSLLIIHHHVSDGELSTIIAVPMVFSIVHGSDHV